MATVGAINLLGSLLNKKADLHAAPQLAALQTMEMPLDGDNTKDS